MLRARYFKVVSNCVFDAHSMQENVRVRIEFCTRSVLDEMLGLLL